MTRGGTVSIKDEKQKRMDTPLDCFGLSPRKDGKQNRMNTNELYDS
ncbi:MAG: hypothetical protein RR206_05160 [Bacteroidaceae bacterium]